MNADGERRLSWVLMTAVLLAGAVLAALTGGWGRRLHWAPPLPPAPLPEPPARPPVAVLPPLSQFTSVWTRPLLASDRRPHSARGRDPVGDFELTGILLTPELQLALLQPLPAAAGSGTAGLRVHVGASIPGRDWQLIRLAPRRAWFTVAGQTRVLDLQPRSAASISLPPEAAEGLEQRRVDALRKVLQRLRPPADRGDPGTEPH